ncbi:MAG: hypothetical protein M3680_16760 [Myxococcota bacterium]|nr:hypothetical protein [Myxococcota bacterium]
MIKLLVGILKGAVIGGAVGYGAYALADATGFGNPWLTYGMVGLLVGLVVGRPIWTLIRDKDQTSWIAILKAAFGFGIGCGLYAIVAKLWGPTWEIAGIGNVFAWPPALGGAIGAIYGGFVELDDAIGDDRPSKKSDPKQLQAKK